MRAVISGSSARSNSTPKLSFIKFNAECAISPLITSPKIASIAVRPVNFTMTSAAITARLA